MNTRATLILAGVLVVLPVPYVLSVGPGTWLIAHGYLPNWIAHLYDPLWFVGGKFKPLGNFVDWYLMQMP